MYYFISIKRFLFLFLGAVFACANAVWAEPINIDTSAIKAALNDIESYETSAKRIEVPIGDKVHNFLASEVLGPFDANYPGPERSWKGYSLRSDTANGVLLSAGDEYYFILQDPSGPLEIRPLSGGKYELERAESQIQEQVCGANSLESYNNYLPRDPLLAGRGGGSVINAESKRLTLPRRKTIRLALNLDQTFLDQAKENNIDPKKYIAAAILDANVGHFISHLNVRLVIVQMNELTNEVLCHRSDNGGVDLMRSAELLSKEKKDLGHLICGQLSEPIAGAAFYGLCRGAPDDSRAYTIFDVRSVSNNVAFPHEVGHQLGLKHTFDDAPTYNLYRDPLSAVESNEGRSMMAYRYGYMAPPLSFPWRDWSNFSGFSIEQAAFYLNNSTCLSDESSSSENPSFVLNFNTQIPPWTPFSIPVRVINTLPSGNGVVAESIEPLGRDELGYFVPLMPHSRWGFNSVSPGTTLRIDFPTDIASFGTRTVSNTPCSASDRKWGAAGCRHSLKPYEHNFRVSTIGKDGAVSSSAFKLQVGDTPFGFGIDYLNGETWKPGEKREITWRPGSGSVAEKVSIYFVPERFIDEGVEFPGTIREALHLAESIPNSGRTQITVPKINDTGFLLLLPVPWGGPGGFIFWSKSATFKIECPGGKTDKSGVCESDTPTPTSTPWLTYTSTPSPRTPTPTPTTSPTGTQIYGTPTPNPSPTPTPTPTSSVCYPEIVNQYECKKLISDFNSVIINPGHIWCEPGYLDDFLECGNSSFLERCRDEDGGTFVQLYMEPPGTGKPVASCIGLESSGEGCNVMHSSCWYGLTLLCIRGCSQAVEN